MKNKNGHWGTLLFLATALLLMVGVVAFFYGEMNRDIWTAFHGALLVVLSVFAKGLVEEVSQ